MLIIRRENVIFSNNKAFDFGYPWVANDWANSLEGLPDEVQAAGKELSRTCGGQKRWSALLVGRPAPGTCPVFEWPSRSALQSVPTEYMHSCVHAKIGQKLAGSHGSRLACARLASQHSAAPFCAQIQARNHETFFFKELNCRHGIAAAAVRCSCTQILKMDLRSVFQLQPSSQSEAFLTLGSPL